VQTIEWTVRFFFILLLQFVDEPLILGLGHATESVITDSRNNNAIDIIFPIGIGFEFDTLVVNFQPFF
jgi:hypothetical protein